MNYQCMVVFIVESTDPLVWEQYYLKINCDDCGELNAYPTQPISDLNYWQKALVNCHNENCDGQIEVQWVLSKVVRKNSD